MNSKKYLFLIMFIGCASACIGLHAVTTGPTGGSDIDMPGATGKTITFILYSPVLGNNHMEVPASWTVGDLKNYIQQEYKIAPIRQIIYFGSIEQTNDNQLLKRATDRKLTILMKTEPYAQKRF